MSPDQAPPPEGFESDYRREVTQESFKELRNLALSAHTKGPLFYLIGGWAAWHFHRGFGSRDIDIIFPDRTILDRFLVTYYRENVYEPYGGPLTQRYHKHVLVANQDVFVNIDAACMADDCSFKEDRTLSLPYSALEDNHATWDIGSVSVRIAALELLILQKIKAHRDRTWDLDHTIDPANVAFLRSKIWKDEYDIRGLASKVEGWDRVTLLARRYRCSDLLEDTLRNLGLGRAP